MGTCVKATCDPHLAITATCARGKKFDLAKCACTDAKPACDPHLVITATCAQGKRFDSVACACVSDGQMCGGFAGIACPSGESCDLGGATHPDAAGTCKPAQSGPTSCIGVDCARGMHCEMKGINGGSIPVCLNN
jgi:hypothetical protein